MTTIRKFDKARRLCQVFWKRACEWDGIRVPNVAFVIFSDDNPWVQWQERAWRLKVKYGLRAGILGHGAEVGENMKIERDDGGFCCSECYATSCDDYRGFAVPDGCKDEGCECHAGKETNG